MPRAMLQAPYNQFLDDNGTPLNGGKVYTYLAGTTTPQATYQAITGSSVNANPVILDSAGRAEIWLDGSYYIKVTDSLDNLIRDADNVASPAGAGNMSTGTYDPAGIGQQLVGLTATQTLSNKTIASSCVLVGTTASSAVTSGNVGEYLSSSIPVASSVALSTGVTANVTSLSLTAGDWDVWGTVATNPASSTTQTIVIGAINTTSATLPTIPAGGAYASQVALATGIATTFPVGTTRIITSSATTAYLVANAAFGVSSQSVYGFIAARRVR